MINTTLKHYIKVYRKFYDKDFCNQIVQQLKNVNWEKHVFYDAVNNKNSSYEDDLDVSIDQIPLKESLDLKIWSVINTYVRQDMEFAADWFNNWSGYSLSRFNKYAPETKMHLHCDHIHALFDGNRKGVPVLSVLGSLNEDYEGGEFFLCGENYELKTGDVIVFPSNFLYPHEVKHIKSGVRYSFVSWAW